MLVLALEVEGLTANQWIFSTDFINKTTKSVAVGVALAARHCGFGSSGDLGPEFLQLSLSQWHRCLGGEAESPHGYRTATGI